MCLLACQPVFSNAQDVQGDGVSSAAVTPVPPSAQSVAPTAPATAPTGDTGAPPTHAVLELPAGTPLIVALEEPVASSTHKRGDTFALRLAEPLRVDGVEWVPAGTRGTGQVVHAAAARGGGAAGELLLAARTLDLDGRTIALRGFNVSVTGQHQPGATLGVALVAGPFAMFVRGREIEVPAGTRGQAKLAAALARPATAPDAATPAGVVGAVASDPPSVPASDASSAPMTGATVPSGPSTATDVAGSRPDTTSNLE